LIRQKFLKNIKVYYQQIVDLREEQKHNQRKNHKIDKIIILEYDENQIFFRGK
jgi:hypothetical protein